MSEYGFEPNYAVQPWCLLQECCIDRGMSRDQLIEASGLSSEQVAGLMDGSQRITDDIASRIARATGTSVDVWLNFDRNYCASIARGAKPLTFHLGGQCGDGT